MARCECVRDMAELLASNRPMAGLYQGVPAVPAREGEPSSAGRPMVCLIACPKCGGTGERKRIDSTLRPPFVKDGEECPCVNLRFYGHVSRPEGASCILCYNNGRVLGGYSLEGLRRHATTADGWELDVVANLYWLARWEGQTDESLRTVVLAAIDPTGASTAPVEVKRTKVYEVEFFAPKPDPIAPFRALLEAMMLPALVESVRALWSELVPHGTVSWDIASKQGDTPGPWLVVTLGQGDWKATKWIWAVGGEQALCRAETRLERAAEELGRHRMATWRPGR